MKLEDVILNNVKAMKKFLLIFGMILLSASVTAQDNTKIGIDVEGMLIGTKNGYSEVVAKLGKPDKYRSYEAEDGMSDNYYYGDSWLHFEADGLFVNFCLLDNRFAALTTIMKGGIRVGDPITKASPLSPTIHIKREDGVTVYIIYQSWDEIVYSEVKNGIIISIWHAMST